MEKIFTGYATRQGTNMYCSLCKCNFSYDPFYLGIDVSQFRFTLNGKRVRSDETPQILGLDDNDEIKVAQLSGALPVRAAGPDDPFLTIQVKECASGDFTQLRATKTTRMELVFNMYAARQGTLMSC